MVEVGSDYGTGTRRPGCLSVVIVMLLALTGCTVLALMLRPSSPSISVEARTVAGVDDLVRFEVRIADGGTTLTTSFTNLTSRPLSVFVPELSGIYAFGERGSFALVGSRCLLSEDSRTVDCESSSDEVSLGASESHEANYRIDILKRQADGMAVIEGGGAIRAPTAERDIRIELVLRFGSEESES